MKSKNLSNPGLKILLFNNTSIILEREGEVQTFNVEHKEKRNLNQANETINESMYERVRRKTKEVQIDESGVYNFKESGIGNNWLIGTDVDSIDTSNFANAFKNGVSACPENLTIPRTLTSVSGETKAVAAIGQWAFYRCGDKSYKGSTRRVTVTRQVMVIKYAGLGRMDAVESFVIEAGSRLETIEQAGLHWIGADIGVNDESKRGTLILPSTLFNVSQHGIHYCNLFKAIIYCGSNPLTNPSDLENDISDTLVKVTNQYPAETLIFGRSPDTNSPGEVQNICDLISEIYWPTLDKCSEDRQISLNITLFSALFISSKEHFMTDLKTLQIT